MPRIAFHVLALGAAVIAGTPAAADPGCAPGCSAVPMYIVNQGPVYSGPGSLPAAAYPFVGYDYPSLPYTGGPYADPIWHHVHHRYMHYQRNPYSYLPVVYTPNVGPRIIRVTHPRRTIRRGARTLIQPTVVQGR